MQILQWLSKKGSETPKVANSSPIPKKKDVKDNKTAKSKDIVVFNNSGIRRKNLKKVEQSGLCCENLNLFNFLRRKDVSKAYFFHTLDLTRLGSFQKGQHPIDPMKIKKEDIARGLGISTHNADSANVRNKVLPITDAVQASSGNKNDQCPNSDKKEKTKSDKMKTLSRMKELLKWAAAAKAEKGGKYIGRKVLQFRNRSALKSVPYNDEMSNDSPKISFRWDLESVSTTSSAISAISAISMASSMKLDQILLNAASANSTPLHVRDMCVTRRGNWITTDEEFVVLEL